MTVDTGLQRNQQLRQRETMRTNLNKMAAESHHAVNLKSLTIGTRTIRYLVTATATAADCPEHQRNLIPLFLGADVLNKCGSMDVKNLGRLHLKHSTSGLASKLYLPNGWQLKGIRGVADAAWFYSIHGFFRVAFSFYSRKDLKELLTKMEYLWMALIEEPFLESKIVIDDIKDVILKKLDDVFESFKQRNQNGGIDSRKGPAFDEKELQCSACKSNLESRPSLQSTESKTPNSKWESNDEDVDKHPIFSEVSSSVGRQPEHFQQDSLSSQGTDDVTGKAVCNNMANSVENMIQKLTREFKDEESCGLIMSYIDSYIGLLIDERANIIEQQSTSFPIKLIKDYIDAKHNRISAIPQDHELAIHIVSSWVGDRFFLFKEIIKHNINAFKQTYIASITELPSPEEIIRTVYPSAMYSLIYLWIKGTGGDVLDGQDDVDEAKKIRSICLLILELLNGSPITGLGHWIFSVI